MRFYNTILLGNVNIGYYEPALEWSHSFACFLLQFSYPTGILELGRIVG